MSAQAGQGRGLVLASNDQPTATETKTEASKPYASKSKKTHARTWRDDEAEARRIAAKYGVYW
jgi:hypothetical protein